MDSSSSSCPSFNDWLDEGDLKIVWTLLAVGVVLIVYGDNCLTRKGLTETIEDFIYYLWGRHHKNTKPTHERAETTKSTGGKGAFYSTIRTEQNFCRDLVDPDVVVPNQTNKHSYEPFNFPATFYAFTGSALLRAFEYIFHTRYLHALVINSFGWGCICSAGSTVLWNVMSWDHYCVDQGFNSDTFASTYIEMFGEKLSTVLGQFLFFPIFCMTGQLRFVLGRWREWQANCYALKDQFAYVGQSLGSLTNVSVPRPVAAEQRKQLYRIYRLLNCFHAMIYVNEYPPHDTNDPLQEYVRLGLLSEEEGAMLSVAPGVEYHIVLTWVQAATYEYATHDAEDGIFDNLRGKAGQHLNFGQQLNPNLYKRTMFLLQDVFVVLIMITYTFSLIIFVPNSEESAAGFQPAVLFAVCLYTASIRLVFMMLFILQTPFHWEGEQISVDALLSETDRMIFFQMRSLFFQ
jgi:hypothetical protein